jgi:hypothetical protein
MWDFQYTIAMAASVSKSRRIMLSEGLGMNCMVDGKIALRPIGGPPTKRDVVKKLAIEGLYLHSPRTIG